jgi:hypothetical protein
MKTLHVRPSTFFPSDLDTTPYETAPSERAVAL